MEINSLPRNRMSSHLLLSIVRTVHRWPPLNLRPHSGGVGANHTRRSIHWTAHLLQGGWHPLQICTSWKRHLEEMIKTKFIQTVLDNLYIERHIFCRWVASFTNLYFLRALSRGINKDRNEIIYTLNGTSFAGGVASFTNL